MTAGARLPAVSIAVSPCARTGLSARAAVAAALSAAACTSTAGGPGARVATTGATDHRVRPPAGNDGRRYEEGDEQEQATPIADR